MCLKKTCEANNLSSCVSTNKCINMLYSSKFGRVWIWVNKKDIEESGSVRRSEKQTATVAKGKMSNQIICCKM